jgi:subtilase family serine protease
MDLVIFLPRSLITGEISMSGLTEQRPSARRVRRPHTLSRRAQLHLEELEARNLLSVFTPAQIRHAYGFDQISFSSGGQTVPADGRGQTIAIVDAYDDPNIANDLKVFDAQFHLPDPVFTKATPQGLPAANASWASEIALDVEWAHAIAPGANILLVEAASTNWSDLLGAVDYARQQPGVVAVSMSWGAIDFPGETQFDSHFLTPGGHLGGSSGLPGAQKLPGGITFIAATGDYGAWYGPEWPAVSPNVLSVGGTSLSLTSTGVYSSETGWNSFNKRQYGSTGGISSYETEPYYQTGVQGTGFRTTPDVAYDANPNTGVYMYDSYNGGWFSGGGTSAGSPQWAALVAIADEGRALAGLGSLDGPTQTLGAIYKMAQTAYATYFHDVTSGYNGYSAGKGYDLVTGLGTPRAKAVVQALMNAQGSGSTITISAVTSSASTNQSANPNVEQQPAPVPGEGNSSSTTGTGNSTQDTTRKNTTQTLILTVTTPVVFVGEATPVVSPAAVTPTPGNVPAVLLSSVPVSSSSPASSSHVGESAPVVEQDDTAVGNQDEDDNDDPWNPEEFSSAQGLRTGREDTQVSSNASAGLLWAEASAACFANNLWSAIPQGCGETPAPVWEKTGSITGPVIALAGLVAIVGGHPGNLGPEARPGKRQRLNLE